MPSNILKKHFYQIKKGGIVTLLKKILSLFFIILRSPLFLISIFVVIIIRLISPWFLVRWAEIPSGRIGHLAKHIELYLNDCEEGINLPKKKYIDFFYLGTRHVVANNQLLKMWKRTITMQSNWPLKPIDKINQFLNIFITGGDKHKIIPTLRDINNLLEKYKPHLNFTEEEENKGQKALKDFGIEKGNKFVCLLVRDSGYLNRHGGTGREGHDQYNRNWSYHNFRDGDIDRYILACEELAKRGYYVFRMGVNVLKPLKSSNPKIIDYANLNRSDFMDIYLGAKCTFCISTVAGFDEVPNIFRKPIAYLGVPIALLETHNKNSLILTKSHISKKTKKKLTLSEIFFSNTATSLHTNEYTKNNVELKENEPEEIRDLAIEMDDRLNGKWKETDEDIILQKKFWFIFEENIKNLNLKEPLHGEIKARFSAKYLRENKNWIR